MGFIQEKIAVTCQQLRALANQKMEEIPLEYVRSDGYKTSNMPPEDGWEPFQPGMRVRGRDGHYWFRARLHTPPAAPDTTFYARFLTGLEDGWDATNPQGLIYLNGKMAQGSDSNHTEVWLEPDTDYLVHNYFYLSMSDAWVPLELSLWRCDQRAEQLYYDMKTALDVCALLPQDSDESIAILSVLEQTANRIDFRDPASDAYFHSVEAARAYIGEELYTRLCSTEGKPVVDCIGHTHIDVEWLWHRAQTREKIQRSFSTASSLMKQYPEYVFMLSQPELYRYLKEEAPEKYEELRQLVREGRWEPEGAMYVEADCNLISGESFVRQILQGTKFFREEFGVECRILFLPDVFGYSAALPQILKKSGIRHFVTSKISWNDTNTLPVDCFLWQGLDGSEIFTNFITTQSYEGSEPTRETTYVGMLTPSEIKGTWARFHQKEYTRHVFTTFGHGDGGGGPTREMLETQRRLAKGLPGMPVTRMEKLLPHLDQVREEFDAACRKTGRTPRWVGELYLEFHRGTYTSIAKNKRNNRKAEWLLQCAEGLSYADLLTGGAYDADGLYHTWNKVLHNQFHDIIPGSSIKEVYEGTDRDYAEIRQYCSAVIDNKLQRLVQQIHMERNTVLVYNPLGFARKGPLTLHGTTVELREEIPAFGWRAADALCEETGVELDGLTAENQYYRLTLDRAGRIASLWDKEADREVFLVPGNELQVFEDYPRQYDNWELTDYYKQKQWTLEDEAVIEPVTDGSRAGFRITRPYLHSRITQTIWLYTQCRRIDIDNEIDWHEHHQVVKAAFPLDVHANAATYEIQFGHVQRPTHANTSWDQAKFEVYGHKWVDLSENGYGVSLLNDCKYGFSTEGSTLKLTMLKCGTDPNPEADQGLHRFTYALLPHVGDFREAGVIQEAYSLNQPFYAAPVAAHTGILPEQFSLVSCDQPNVIVETVKKAEADDGMIVRMYEAFDRRTRAGIRVAEDFSRAFLCDLMEHVVEELPLTDHTVQVKLSNFEILTLKFTK